MRLSDGEAWRKVAHELPNDRARLLAAMRPGRWYTKPRLSELTGISTHALSARLSELRAAGVSVERRLAPGADRVWLYRVCPDSSSTAPDQAGGGTALQWVRGRSLCRSSHVE